METFFFSRIIIIIFSVIPFFCRQQSHIKSLRNVYGVGRKRNKNKRKKKNQKGDHFGIKQTKDRIALGETSNPDSPNEEKK